MTRTLRDFIIILAATVAIGGPLMVWAADHAGAAEGTYYFDDFAIPNPTRPPTVRTLLTIDTSEIAGQTCQVIVDTVNGESVHVKNYITVEGGVPTITVTGTEDGVNGQKQNTTTVVMGDSLVVNNHFQRATSVEGDVIISCEPASTTTSTSVTTTSTTAPSSTTTSTPNTTTTAPENTTTTINQSSTTAPDTSTTTSPSSSTTSPDGTTSTSVPPTGSTEPPPSTPPTLPDTGPAGVAGLVGAGVALVTLGFGVLRAGRES